MAAKSATAVKFQIGPSGPPEKRFLISYTSEAHRRQDMFDVVGLGCSCLDFFGVVPHIPGLDEEIEMLESTQQGGGEVATALVTLAKLGATVAYIGKIGDDPVGYFIKHEFDHYGVDTSHMIVEPGASSLASMVMVDQATGKRTIVGDKPTASELQPSEVQPGVIEKAKYLHLDGTFRQAVLDAARRARSAGVTVVLDADVMAYDQDVDRLIELTNILIPSKGFAERFTGTDDPERAIGTMRSYGPAVVALTLGEEGSVCYADGRLFHTPAFTVDVVDTTGAGDVFHGAFIFGMLRDWPFEKAATFASAVAAMKCRKLGGRLGIPTLPEALAFLKDRNAESFV